MKNVFGKDESLKLFDKYGKNLYYFYRGPDGRSWERTFDSNGNVLLFKDSIGKSSERTYDSNGRGLVYKNSEGYSSEYTRDLDGNELTYKNSNGVKRGFDIPEKSAVMKNVFGTNDNLELYNKDGKMIYDFSKCPGGFSWDCTYDSNEKMLGYKDSDGYSSEYTRDSDGKELTFEDSNGVKRSFDIPKFTMQQLFEKLGKFELIN